MVSKKRGGGKPEPSGSPIIVDGSGSLKVNFGNDYDLIHKVAHTEIAEVQIIITGGGPASQTITVPNGSKAMVKITLR